MRDPDGTLEDCAVIARDDLLTLIPAMRPREIDFECEPGEAADLGALVAELRQRAGGARLRLVAADVPPDLVRNRGGVRQLMRVTPIWFRFD